MAVIKKKVVKETEIVDKLVCDRCGREMDPETDIVEWQEAVTVAFTGGYGSVFGDTDTFRCDLCQHCVKETLGPYIKLVKEGW